MIYNQHVCHDPGSVVAAPARGSIGGSTAAVQTPVDQEPTAVQEVQPVPANMADATQLEPGAGNSPAEMPAPANFSHTPDASVASVPQEPAARAAAVVQSDERLLKDAEQNAQPQAVDAAAAGLPKPVSMKKMVDIGANNCSCSCAFSHHQQSE